MPYCRVLLCDYCYDLRSELKMSDRQTLFDLWCSIGRDPCVVIPQYERDTQGPISQGFKPRVDHYSFTEND